MIAEKVQELIASKSAEWRPFEDQIAHWMRELAREVLELAAQECERERIFEKDAQTSAYGMGYESGQIQCAVDIRKEAEKL